MKQQSAVDKFIKERGWDKYHKPKELLLGMVEEIGEFRNIIKWEQDEDKILQKIRDNHDEVEDFFGDMLWELASLANYCGVNLEESLENVIKKHEHRYPIDKVRDKHTNE